jgi:hypothetical protein
MVDGGGNALNRLRALLAAYIIEGLRSWAPLAWSLIIIIDVDKKWMGSVALPCLPFRVRLNVKT